MEKILKLFSYSMILAIAINMMSPLMIYAAAKPLPVNDYPTSSSAMSQVEMQKQLAVEQKKAQEEMYKAMGLSTAEIEYIEKNDFEAIKTRLDKYVTYDKDGYAKMARITSAQSRKDGISSREISIGMKMVASYNETVRGLDTQILKQSQLRTRSNESNIVYKTVLDRGISTLAPSQSRSLATNSTGFEYFQWWGYRVYLTNEFVNILTNAGITWSAGQILGLLTKTVSLGAMCAASTVLCVGLAAYIAVNYYWMVSYNRQCGRRGVFFNGAWWTGWVPVITKIC
jgi:hypothetical protein